MVEADAGRCIEDAFCHFEETPLAAASIGHDITVPAGRC